MLANEHMFSDSIAPIDLLKRIGSDKSPIILDVRRDSSFLASAWVLPGAQRAAHIDPQVTGQLTGLSHSQSDIVCYCVHGHNVSQMAVADLRSRGYRAAWLEGGFAAWEAEGRPLIARAPDAEARFGKGTIWVTRRRPKIDRVACPWFIRRFVDPKARFFFVEGAHALASAAELNAIAFDVEGAPVTHDGPRCSFDTLLDRYEVSDVSLRRLADIVRGADTANLGLGREAGGLLSISLGLSALESDDRVMLERGFHLYDGLYAYLRFASNEPHNWPPKA